MALGDLLDRENTNQVVFEGNSFMKKVTLNRPRKLNTLTLEMISEIEKGLEDYENDPQIKLVILKANGKAFCAGGDIVAIYKFLIAGHWSFGASYSNKFFTLQYLVATYNKPLVAIIDGMVMGGGAIVFMLARFKIVTENTVFALPEGALGSHVGGSYFLSRLPGYFGEYLGLTGARIDGAEMISCGLATHFVLSKDLQLLENALDKLDSSDSSDESAISQLISEFIHKPNIKQHSAYSRLLSVNKCFCRETIEDILLALEKERENEDDHKNWIVDSINLMKSCSPLSLKVSLRLIRGGRRHNLKECLIIDYTTFCHVLLRTVSNDLFEGVRAKLIEKDEKPKWQPSKLELVTKKMLDRFFDKLVDEENWEFVKLSPRSNLVDNNVSYSKL